MNLARHSSLRWSVMQPKILAWPWYNNDSDTNQYWKHWPLVWNAMILLIISGWCFSSATVSPKNTRRPEWIMFFLQLENPSEPSKNIMRMMRINQSQSRRSCHLLIFRLSFPAKCFEKKLPLLLTTLEFDKALLTNPFYATTPSAKIGTVRNKWYIVNKIALDPEVGSCKLNDSRALAP